MLRALMSSTDTRICAGQHRSSASTNLTRSTHDRTTPETPASSGRGLKTAQPTLPFGRLDRASTQSGGTVTEYRIEHDTMGEVRVPKDALYAAQTQRAVENFPISGRG